MQNKLTELSQVLNALPYFLHGFGTSTDVMRSIPLNQH